MPDYNRTILMGNLTRDPILRYTSNSKPVCNLGLAVNDRIKKGDEWVDTVDFVEITLWERKAEIAQKYLRKGSPVFIEAKLRHETREQDGERRSQLTVVVKQLILLEKLTTDAGESQVEEPAPGTDEEVRF